MAVKFRVLLRPIETSDTTAAYIIKAITVLHNFLLDNSPAALHPSKFADRGDEDNGLWRQFVIPMSQAVGAFRKRKANNHNLNAGRTREYLSELLYNNQI